MLKVFYGENRAAAEKAAKAFLGDGYEMVEGEALELGDLPGLFEGVTLFGGEKRRILLKNVSENPAVWEKLVDYKDTDYDVAVWEVKINKKTAGYKALKEAGVEMKEFAALVKPDMGVVFGVLDLAMRDGEKAVREVEKIEGTQDPFMFFGLLVSQMLKRLEARGGVRERRILKEMAAVDLRMKTTAVEPWLLIKAFLLRVKLF